MYILTASIFTSYLIICFNWIVNINKLNRLMYSVFITDYITQLTCSQSSAQVTIEESDNPGGTFQFKNDTAISIRVSVT